MKELIATEGHRMGTSVYLSFVDENGEDVLPGGRYVDAIAWDSDPAAILAKTFDEISKRVLLPEAVATLDAVPVKIKEADVQSKLAAIATGAVIKK